MKDKIKVPGLSKLGFINVASELVIGDTLRNISLLGAIIEKRYEFIYDNLRRPGREPQRHADYWQAGRVGIFHQGSSASQVELLEEGLQGRADRPQLLHHPLGLTGDDPGR